MLKGHVENVVGKMVSCMMQHMLLIPGTVISLLINENLLIEKFDEGDIEWTINIIFSHYIHDARQFTSCPTTIPLENF